MINNQKSEFETLLDSTFTSNVKLQPGELVEAEIVAISDDCIFLQLDGKSEGQLDTAEMVDKDGNLTVKEGDSIKAYFLSSKNGIKQFTTRISGDKADKAILENAYKSEIPIEGIVEKEIKGGYEIQIGESHAFCPYSQMGLQRIDNPEDYIGKHLTFKILEYSENGRNILVSNRIILKEELQDKIEVLKKSLHEDTVVKGTVKSIQSFGAFIDIGGVQALLPISEISRSRVEDINKALSIGQKIEAVVLKLDWENERISVSMKKLLTDPWDAAKSKYKIGSNYAGTIARITNFGAFVSLEPGLDGLIHISDFENETRINHPKEVVKTGQSVRVEIKDMDIEKKRISLKLFKESQLDEKFKQYLEPESDTYNPFAKLLKDKK